MVWRPADPSSTPGWVPKNDVERALDKAAARGDGDEFLRVFAAAELYLPQVPKEGVVIRAQEWRPLTRQVAGRVSVPVFTSLAAMGAVVFAGSYAVTRYDELADHGVSPDWWLDINPGTPIEAHLPAAAVGQVVRGTLSVVEDRLFPSEDDADDVAYPVDEPLVDDLYGPIVPDRVLHDPAFMATHDETDEALLGSTVVVPTTREVVDLPGELSRPGFPWRRAGPSSAATADPATADRPTIEAFTTDDRFVSAYPESPGVRVPFPVLMAAWPEGHALFVNPGSPVSMVYPADQVPVLRRRAIDRLPPWYRPS